MLKKIKRIFFYQSIVTFLTININYNWHFSEKDDDVIDEVCQALQTYNLAIYEDDISSWDNPVDLEKMVIYEIQQATAFLKNDNLIEKNLLINYQKMQLKNDYKLDLAKQTLFVNLQYGTSKIKEFKFHAWEVKREEVITAINRKIVKNININKIYEDDWQSLSYVSSLGNFYLKNLLETIEAHVIINDYKIFVNYRRIFFESWTNLRMLKYQVILQYRYFFNTSLISLTLNLQHIVNYEQIIPKLINILGKSNVLNIKINQQLQWNDEINWLKLINFHLSKWKIMINGFLEKFKYQKNDFVLKISKISPFGPFDQDITIFLSLNESDATIPLRVSFDNKIDETKIEDLEHSITNKLAKMFIKSEKAQSISFQTLQNIIRQNLGNRIEINHQLVPFDVTKLQIKGWNISENQLLINTKLKNYAQVMIIKINLI